MNIDESKRTAKPTNYNGTVYDSELEAKWARFFDNIGVRTRRLPEDEIYHSEGEGTRPDFELPEFDMLVEVSRSDYGENEETRVRKEKQMRILKKIAYTNNKTACAWCVGDPMQNPVTFFFTAYSYVPYAETRSVEADGIFIGSGQIALPNYYFTVYKMPSCFVPMGNEDLFDLYNKISCDKSWKENNKDLQLMDNPIAQAAYEARFYFKDDKSKDSKYEELPVHPPKFPFDDLPF